MKYGTLYNQGCQMKYGTLYNQGCQMKYGTLYNQGCQMKYGTLYNQGCQIFRVTRSIKDDLFLLRSFCYDLWYNFFWGGGRKLSYSSNIFKIQKRIIRVITNSGSRDYCPGLFQKLNILLSPAQCVFSLLLFVIKNRGLYKSKFEIHIINTDIVSLLIYVLLYQS